LYLANSLAAALSDPALYRLGRSVHTTKNTEALVVAGKKIGPAANAGETKYTVVSGDQNAGRIHNLKTDKNSF
jgi:hypothetical protein